MEAFAKHAALLKALNEKHQATIAGLQLKQKELERKVASLKLAAGTDIPGKLITNVEAYDATCKELEGIWNQCADIDKEASNLGFLITTTRNTHNLIVNRLWKDAQVLRLAMIGEYDAYLAKVRSDRSVAQGFSYWQRNSTAPNTVTLVKTTAVEFAGDNMFVWTTKGDRETYPLNTSMITWAEHGLPSDFLIPFLPDVDPDVQKACIRAMHQPNTVLQFAA